MSNPTLDNVQAVNPVLTNMLVAYRQQAMDFVAERLLPGVAVDHKTGTYYVLNKKEFLADSMERRAPGDPFAERGYKFSTATYDADLWGLETPIADEVRGNNQTPLDLERGAVEFLGDQSMIRKERALASTVFAASVWTTQDNNSTNDWDDTTNGDPIVDVRTARRTIRQLIGRGANTMVLGEIVHDALMVHPDILDRIKYVQNAAGAQPVMAAIAALFELDQYLVSKAVYNSANLGQSASISAIIDDDAWLGYINPALGLMDPSALKRFTWAPGGGDGEIVVYREQKRKSDVAQISESWDLKVTSADAGAIWLDVV